VQIRYPRFSFFQRRRGAGTIELSTAATWQIEIRGGTSTCSFDLRDLTLTALAVFDGAFRLELRDGTALGDRNRYQSNALECAAVEHRRLERRVRGVYEHCEPIT
jgi:hypothetical protein